MGSNAPQSLAPQGCGEQSEDFCAAQRCESNGIGIGIIEKPPLQLQRRLKSSKHPL